MISFNIARVVLSGSFHRDRDGLERAYIELLHTTCQVLSPHRLDFDKADFVRNSAEQELSARSIEDYHLLGIKQADFVWLHAPEGYIGRSTAFEIGYAYAVGTPVFSKTDVSDVMLQEYITRCTSVYDAKRLVSNQG